MSWPNRLWWLSIYFSLLALCIYATEINTEAPSTTLKAAEQNEEENYEMIDVAQSSNDQNHQIQTGQTTRIFTTEDVGDDFWFKHLGEDFKYAIHLQVGDRDQYDGVYNDSALYDAQPDYQHAPQMTPINVSIDDYNNKTLAEDTKTTSHYPNNNTTNTNTENIYTTTNNSETNQAEEQSNNKYEEIFTMNSEDMNLMQDLHSTVQQSTEKQINNTSHTTHNNTNFTPPTPKVDYQYDKDTNHYVDQKTVSVRNWKSPSSQVVVTLPHDEKAVHHLTDENTPVVVKMPPVIYHHSPSYTTLTPQTQMNTNTYTSSPTHTHSLQHTQQDSIDLYSNQYSAHEHNFQQYDNIAYPQYESPQTITHQSPFYTSNLHDNPAVYNRGAVFNSQHGATINTISSQSPKEQLQKSPGSIRFILRKPSTPYNSPSNS